MKEYEPSYNKGGHYLRGQMDRVLKKTPYISKSELTFIQRRYVQRNPRSGTSRGKRP